MDKSLVFLAFAATLSLQSLASADTKTTFVSTTGNDMGNDCSNPATPCRQLIVAAGLTISGGQIIILSGGNYERVVPVTLQRTVTISAMANDVIISHLVINAGLNDVVTLRGFVIDPGGQIAGVDAVRFDAGGSLRLENCLIRGSAANFGINFKPSGASELYVQNCTIADNDGAAGGGIQVKPGVSGSAKVTLDDVRIESNRVGLLADGAGGTGAISILLRDTVVVDSASIGIGAFESAVAGAPTNISLERSTIANSGTHGIFASRSTAIVRVQQSNVTGNASGLTSANGGQIISHGGNAVSGNTTNGAFTATVPPL